MNDVIRANLIRQHSFFLIDPPMSKPSFRDIIIFRKIRLHPLNISQTRAINIFVHHPGGNKVGSVIFQFFHVFRFQFSI